MPNIAMMLQQGEVNYWLFIPTAILLGALHGLEPGHSKNMMAAFIITVRGTIGQAALLGFCAALSHSLVVFIIALLGIYYGNKFGIDANSPYFEIASAALIILIAVSMIIRIIIHRRHSAEETAHDKAHADEIKERFTGRHITTAQIIMFGAGSGLIPCSASITILIICLNLHKIALGTLLVLSFSLGLALIMMAVGVIAALSVKHIKIKGKIASGFAEKLPFISAGLIILLGLYIGYNGITAL